MLNEKGGKSAKKIGADVVPARPYMRDLAALFWSFLKIGAFTVGGGYAMLPVIQREVVETRKWATEAEMVDIVVVGQTLPGVISLNTATAVGNRVAGKPGAVSATLGVILPSLVVMTVIAAAFTQLRANAYVDRVFSGARPAVAGLMAAAVYRLGRAAIGSRVQAAMAAAAFAAILLGLPAPYALLACGGLSVLVYFGKRLYGGARK